MFERLMRVYQEPGIMMNSNCASEVPSFFGSGTEETGGQESCRC